MTFADLRSWASTWGDLASVSGVLLALIGFAATLWGVLKAKSAAESASAAAQSTRTTLLLIDTVADLSSALAMMEEVKRLHRAAAWAVLPDRYSALRRQLIRIRSSNHLVQPEHHGILQTAIAQLLSVEQKVDVALARGTPPPSTAKLNQVVSTQIDSVESVLRTLQRQSQ